MALNENLRSFFLVVAGVGNDGEEINIDKLHVSSLPTSIPREGYLGINHIIRVGALSKYIDHGIKSIYKGFNSGSNYGKDFVDIMAPGQLIPVLIPNQSHMITANIRKDPNIKLEDSSLALADIVNGTSEATAIVTGTIALMASCNPRTEAGNIRQKLLESSDIENNLKDKVNEGRTLNIYEAVERYCMPDVTIKIKDEIETQCKQKHDKKELDNDMEKIYL